MGVLTREEGPLLYVAYAGFVVLAIWRAKKELLVQKGWRFRSALALLFIVPLAISSGAKTTVRQFVKQQYGLPILHEMSEGEYPRLIAAMREVRSRTMNRHVMITQEALQKIRTAVPLLAPLIDRLPPPGKTTYSYDRFKISDEWTNGWMVFWVRKAGADAGLTPDSVTDQKFYREARLGIEEACRNGRLPCSKRGDGLLPPFELRWLSAFIGELRGVLRMSVSPGVEVMAHLPANLFRFRRIRQYVINLLP